MADMAETQEQSPTQTQVVKNVELTTQAPHKEPDTEKEESNNSSNPQDNEAKVEHHNKNTPYIEPPSDVVELCQTTFQKTAEYLQGELDGTIEDYKLLEKMNNVTMNKYSEMKNIALSISGALKDLNDKYEKLQPYLQQIDQIDEGVAQLEKAAYTLDQYSKRLELKFKALEKR